MKMQTSALIAAAAILLAAGDLASAPKDADREKSAVFEPADGFGFPYQDDDSYFPRKRHPAGGDDDAQRGGKMREAFKYLSPEDMENIRKIRAENPDAADKEMKRILAEKKKAAEEQEQQLKKLADMTRDSKDDNEKEQLAAQMRQILEAQFEERMQINQKRLENAEKKLSELKRKLEERKARKKEIIDEKIRDYLKDPNLKW